MEHCEKHGPYSVLCRACDLDAAVGDGAKALSQGGEAERILPPSLAAEPNIPWEHQTLGELEQERDYWVERVASAPGFASAKAADDHRKACEFWIAKKTPSSAESAASQIPSRKDSPNE